MIPAWLTGIGARAVAIGAAVLAALGAVLAILAGARKAGRDEQKAADLAEHLEKQNAANQAAARARGDDVVSRLRNGQF